ncbi:MAG: trimethylamine methyltransferase family protein [Spirochaetia bacterium]|jgi:trimethylamine--corrinoid protein Co-methyltransferase|nr:trimethylamine methyltransferase family protein [Spirochaetia bacterium]
MSIMQRKPINNQILSDEQIKQVNEYALRMMEEIGCRVQSEEALDILSRAGCDVTNPDKIKIPRKLVLEALEAAPSQIEVFSLDGELAMELKEGSSNYGTGSDCPTTIDLDTGERRDSSKDDVARLARFSDALPNIDFVMSFGIASDGPKGGNFVHQYDGMLKNTKKPIIVTGHGRNDMNTMIEMAAAAVGGVNKLKSKPPLILYTEPLSPLFHTEMGVDKGLVCCDYDVPFIYIGSPMLGASAPVTLEGILVQTVAESLAGLVIFQKKKEGAKFIFGGDATVMDMRTNIFRYGAPELNVINQGLADMAHYYKLPFFCIAGASDSKVLDAQAGFESAMSIYMATKNGCNIIHDCGYLEYGSTSSFESILFADEIISSVEYLLRPLDFNDRTVAFDVVQRVMDGSNFLMEDHTVEHFRKSLWFPRFISNERYTTWEDEGKKDLAVKLNEEAKKIFKNHQPVGLPENIISEIDRIVAGHHPDVE